MPGDVGIWLPTDEIAEFMDNREEARLLSLVLGSMILGDCLHNMICHTYRNSMQQVAARPKIDFVFGQRLLAPVYQAMISRSIYCRFLTHGAHEAIGG